VSRQERHDFPLAVDQEVERTFLPFVREAVAAGWVVFKHIAGKLNLSDCLTKNLSAPKLTPFTNVLMVQSGDLHDSLPVVAPTGGWGIEAGAEIEFHLELSH